MTPSQDVSAQPDRSPIAARSQPDPKPVKDLSPQQFAYGWIGPRDAMQHLGIGSLNALYRLIRDWQLPYGRVGVRYRFRRCDLDRWAARRVEALSVAKAD